jgi:hypothetical protein
MLPSFDADGLLPPNDYVLTCDELRASSLVIGPPDRPPDWDEPWRRYLVDQLEILVKQLWAVEITEIGIAGSFVECNKGRPGDIDGFFTCDAFEYPNLLRQLNASNNTQMWDSRIRLPDPDDLTKYKPLMWHAHRVELFPTYRPPFHEACGIPDRCGNPQTFAQAFRTSRLFKPRGIVLIGGCP